MTISDQLLILSAAIHKLEHEVADIKRRLTPEPADLQELEASLSDPATAESVWNALDVGHRVAIWTDIGSTKGIRAGTIVEYEGDLAVVQLDKAGKVKKRLEEMVEIPEDWR